MMTSRAASTPGRLISPTGTPAPPHSHPTIAQMTPIGKGVQGGGMDSYVSHVSDLEHLFG